MGSTSLNREKGTSNREWFAEHWDMNPYPSEVPTDHVTAVRVTPHKRTILECATVNGVFYAAVKDHDTGEVWALVVKTWWGRGYFNFTYKDMDETQGPCYYDAPAKVLDLLTDRGSNGQYAEEWRKHCRDTLAQKAKARAVKPGTKIVFSHKIGFGDDVEEDTFVFIKRNQLRRAGDNRLVNFRGWRDRAFTVIEEAA